MLFDFSSLSELYLSEIEKEMNGRPGLGDGTITEADISSLPEPVRRFFRHCGYLGMKKMAGARIDWEEARFRRSRETGWMSLDCHQFNSVPVPARIVYMKSRLLGVLPFEGRDKYQDGRGSMLMKLLGCLRVADARGSQMDVSALVTVLAETFLVPTYALQDYIGWTPLDAGSARAEIKYGGQEASGIFRFTTEGEVAGFETEDRYYSEKGTEYSRKKWTASSSDYGEAGGIRFPTRMRATWHDREGDFTYFEGRIRGIEYDAGRGFLS